MKRLRSAKPVPELAFAGAEPFALVTQSTLDGDRLAAQRRQSSLDRAEANSLQTSFSSLPSVKNPDPDADPCPSVSIRG